MSAQLIARLIDACVDTVVRNADELTALDSAIGDGDHGLNMQRGFEAVAAAREDIAAQPLQQALHKAGMTLVMKVGGASGPLYGSALMAMAKADGSLVEMLHAAVNAVKSRGKSDVGEKTMLDVLVPVLDAVKAGADADSVRETADRAVIATREMLATKGRASFLGERSIGHIDPGARSACLLVHAVCDALESEDD